MLGKGDDLDPLVSEPLQSFCAHVFNLHCEHIQALAKRHHGLFILKVPLDESVGQVAARSLGAGVHHFHAHVPIHGFLHHHAAQLAAAEHPDAQGGPQGRKFGC